MKDLFMAGTVVALLILSIVLSCVLLTLFCFTRKSYRAVSTSTALQAIAPRKPCFPIRRRILIMTALYFLVIVCVDLMILMIVGFDRLHPALGAVAMSLVLCLAAIPVSFRYSLWGHPSVNRWAGNLKEDEREQGRKDSWRRFLVSFFFILPFCFLASYFIQGLCVQLHPFTVSSTISRSVTKSLCPPDSGICFMYLTLPEDCRTSIILNLHTALPNNVSITLQHQSGSLALPTNSSVLLLEEGPRYIHWVVVQSLQPSSAYIVIASINGLSRRISFKTCPAIPPVTLAFGGDTGDHESFDRLVRQAASRDVNAIILGGDIAYANCMWTCHRVWDSWIARYTQAAIAPDGRSIPMSLAIGNHESGGFRVPKSRILFFFDYFLQQSVALTPSQEFVSPYPRYRGSFHAHVISDNVSVIVLDSAVTEVTHDGVQLEWLKRNLQRNVTRTFISYHHPIYPSAGSYGQWQSVEGRKHWAPLFERHNVSAVFENHDHMFKRTKRIRKESVDPLGIVYLGDGRLGVDDLIARSAPDKWYLEEVSDQSHIWLARVGRRMEAEAFAINEAGETFDRILL